VGEIVKDEGQTRLETEPDAKVSLSRLDEIRAMYRELANEVFSIATSGQENPGQDLPDPASLPKLQRRLLIRSMASFIEAIANGLKAEALVSWANASLSGVDRSLASDQAYSLKENGTAHIGVVKSSTRSNLLFALRIYAQANGAGFSLDTSGAGWQDTQHLIKVRDRLTHPKNLVDLTVSDEEIAAACRAFHWFIKQLKQLLIEVHKGLRSEIAAEK
jgi:hypothetical protein